MTQGRLRHSGDNTVGLYDRETGLVEHGIVTYASDVAANGISTEPPAVDLSADGQFVTGVVHSQGMFGSSVDTSEREWAAFIRDRGAVRVAPIAGPATPCGELGLEVDCPIGN